MKVVYVACLALAVLWLFVAAFDKDAEEQLFVLYAILFAILACAVK